MPKETPTTIRLKATTKAALNAFLRAKNQTASNAIETFVEEGLKRERFLTPSGRLGKAAMRDDGDE